MVTQNELEVQGENAIARNGKVIRTAKPRRNSIYSKALHSRGPVPWRPSRPVAESIG